MRISVFSEKVRVHADAQMGISIREPSVFVGNFDVSGTLFGRAGAFGMRAWLSHVVAHEVWNAPL